MHGKNKYQSRENRNKVRQVFLEHWDPIGIRHLKDWPEDEYDAYVGKTYVMLMDEHASAQIITDYLFDIASRHMGLGNKAELLKRSAETADILLRMRPEFETH